ncbi:hypothetical protein PAL_GLEAN10013903 [Pteropus alecto]|uniref:Uncharacterized protein n=1 Tax=Pteropus alecto TaxID=9402 RepID=L5K7W8_PTEAL|nr:hypothetical protein PAL_GLEAN10013903 [Pteropus alecto]
MPKQKACFHTEVVSGGRLGLAKILKKLGVSLRTSYTWMGKQGRQLHATQCHFNDRIPETFRSKYN